jgi:hypothetical protein
MFSMLIYFLWAYTNHIKAPEKAKCPIEQKNSFSMGLGFYMIFANQIIRCRFYCFWALFESMTGAKLQHYALPVLFEPYLQFPK